MSVQPIDSRVQGRHSLSRMLGTALSLVAAVVHAAAAVDARRHPEKWALDALGVDGDSFRRLSLPSH